MLTLAEIQLILAALNGAVSLGERIAADIRAAHAAGKPATVSPADHAAFKAAVAAVPKVSLVSNTATDPGLPDPYAGA